MVGIFELWLPILVSAVAVFVVSSIIHSVIGFHANDWTRIPGEDRILSSLGQESIPKGNYFVPYARPSDFGNPEIQKKFEKGPVAFMTVLPNGLPAMGSSLIAWFVYCIVAGVLVAYVTGRTMGPGGDYLEVFRVAGTVAFFWFAGAEPTASIWFKRKWSTTAKFMLDGLIYALVTAGVFGWLWPR